MALSLTYDTTLSRVRLTADGLLDGFPVRLERSTDQVRWATVRGGGEMLPAGGLVRLDDYEFTAGVANYYRIAGAYYRAVTDTFTRVAPPRLNANPFFETDVANWTPAGGTFVRSTAQAHEGTASGLFTPDGVSASVSVRSERVPVCAGASYWASAWVRCAVARSVNLQVQWFDAGGVELQLSSSGVAVPATTWTLLDATFTAPAGAVECNLRLSMGSTPAASHLLHVDETSVRPTTGWGAADTGQVWQHFGTATAFTANGSVGQHTHTALNSGRISVIDIGATDARVRVTGSVPVAAVGAGTALTIYAIARFTDDNNFYQARLGFIPDLNVTCSVRRRVAGVDSTLASVVTGLTHVAGTRYTVELDVTGGLLRARVWREGDPVPDWQATATDTALTTGTKVGVRTIIDAGSGNTMPLTYTIDNAVVSSPTAPPPTAAITPTIDRVWLKSVARPFLNRPVIVADYSDVTRPGRSGLFDVVGRSYPVSVLDVRGSRRWTLDVLTHTPGDADDLDLLLASGDVLLVQVPAGSGVPAGYVVVGDTNQRRTARRTARRVHELPCTEVAAPGPDVVGATVTCQGVLNAYATCAAVLAAHPTCLDLMELIGDPTDVVVP